MWHYVLSRIWRNPYRDIEIDRNWRSEELGKLAGGQKIFIFNCSMRGRSGNFYFQGGFPIRGINFLGDGSYASAYYALMVGKESKSVGREGFIQGGDFFWWEGGFISGEQSCAAPVFTTP